MLSIFLNINPNDTNLDYINYVKIIFDVDVVRRVILNRADSIGLTVSDYYMKESLNNYYGVLTNIELKALEGGHEEFIYGLEHHSSDSD